MREASLTTTKKMEKTARKYKRFTERNKECQTRKQAHTEEIHHEHQYTRMKKKGEYKGSGLFFHEHESSIKTEEEHTHSLFFLIFEPLLRRRILVFRSDHTQMIGSYRLHLTGITGVKKRKRQRRDLLKEREGVSCAMHPLSLLR